MIYRCNADHRRVCLYTYEEFCHYDYIGLLEEYGRQHSDKKGIAKKVEKAVSTIKNDPMYIACKQNGDLVKPKPYNHGSYQTHGAN